MERMKTFGLYALCVILFFVYSDVIMNIAINGTYKPMHTTIIENSNAKIEITENKSTSVNGYVGGSITNTSQDTITKKYIKIDVYSVRDVLLGSKYVEVGNLKSGQAQDFRMGFKLNRANYCKVSVVDQVEEQVKEEEFISDNVAGIALITAVIFLCYF